MLDIEINGCAAQINWRPFWNKRNSQNEYFHKKINKVDSVACETYGNRWYFLTRADWSRSPNDFVLRFNELLTGSSAAQILNIKT